MKWIRKRKVKKIEKEIDKMPALTLGDKVEMLIRIQEPKQ